jgi:hypothetical protein
MKSAPIVACLLLASVTTGRAWESPLCEGTIDHGEPSGYRVVAYDAPTKTWTIHRNGTFYGKYMVKRLIVACESRKYRDGETLKGRDVCDLDIGRLYLYFRPSGCTQGNYEAVNEMLGAHPLLSIAEGPNVNDADTQFFDILRYEVLPDRR